MVGPGEESPRLNYGALSHHFRTSWATAEVSEMGWLFSLLFPYPHSDLLFRHHSLQTVASFVYLSSRASLISMFPPSPNFQSQLINVSEPWKGSSAVRAPAAFCNRFEFGS